MATAEQIRNRAAVMLGILAEEGETLPSYRAADLDKSYTEVYASLDTKGIAVWDSDEDVPDEYTPHVVTLVARGRVDDYSVSNDRYSRIVAAAREAKLEIRELNRSDALETPKPEYF